MLPRISYQQLVSGRIPSAALRTSLVYLAGAVPFYTSNVLPLTRGIAAARILIAEGELNEVSRLLMGEFMIGCIYVFFGYRLFRWFEIQAKRRGILETG